MELCDMCNQKIETTRNSDVYRIKVYRNSEHWAKCNLCKNCLVKFWHQIAQNVNHENYLQYGA